MDDFKENTPIWGNINGAINDPKFFVPGNTDSAPIFLHHTTSNADLVSLLNNGISPTILNQDDTFNQFIVKDRIDAVKIDGDYYKHRVDQLIDDNIDLKAVVDKLKNSNKQLRILRKNHKTEFNNIIENLECEITELKSENFELDLDSQRERKDIMKILEMNKLKNKKRKDKKYNNL